MEIRTQLTKNGRILLPVRFRKALDLQPADELILRLEEDSIQVLPVHQAVIQAQDLVKKYVPQGTSLVDELIKTRRQEANND